jgi:hypothetical protein
MILNEQGPNLVDFSAEKARVRSRGQWPFRQESGTKIATPRFTFFQ